MRSRLFPLYGDLFFGLIILLYALDVCMHALSSLPCASDLAFRLRFIFCSVRLMQERFSAALDYFRQEQQAAAAAAATAGRMVSYNRAET